MAGEIVTGKRTLIERHGKEFELPHGHTAYLTGAVDQSGRQWVTLGTPGEGSLFEVDQLEERGDDAVVVHLGAELGQHGLAYFVGEQHKAPKEFRGYPFPHE
jgi:hypothetical protein